MNELYAFIGFVVGCVITFLLFITFVIPEQEFREVLTERVEQLTSRLDHTSKLLDVCREAKK